MPVNIIIRFTPEQAAALAEHRQRTDVPTNAFVRRAVVAALGLVETATVPEPREPRAPTPALHAVERNSYNCARQRCVNNKNPRYADYGGRGIKFLFTSFEQFFDELGERPEGKTLDRIDNDGNYESGNVHWATPTEQNNNRRVKALAAEQSQQLTAPVGSELRRFTTKRSEPATAAPPVVLLSPVAHRESGA
jgi:hypothetical protein